MSKSETRKITNSQPYNTSSNSYSGGLVVGMEMRIYCFSAVNIRGSGLLIRIKFLSNYRPQRSCRKVMFLYLSVSHFVHRVGVSQHAMGQTPPWADTPRQTPPGQTPPWADTPRQTPPWVDTPQADTPLGYPSMHWGRHPPPHGRCRGRYASYWNAYFLITEPHHNK